MNDFGWLWEGGREGGAPTRLTRPTLVKRSGHGSLDVWSGGLAHPAAKLFLSGVMIETRRGGEGVSRRET